MTQRRDDRSAKETYLARQRDYHVHSRKGDRDFLAQLDLLDAYCSQMENRHTRIRVRQWVDKLSEPMTNTAWKKNRNAYAQLLVQQLEAGELSEPFTRVPKSGPLDLLPHYLRYNQPKSPTYRCSRSPHRAGRRPSTAGRLGPPQQPPLTRRSAATVTGRGQPLHNALVAAPVQQRQQRRQQRQQQHDDNADLEERERAREWERLQYGEWDRSADKGSIGDLVHSLQQRLQEALRQIEEQQHEIDSLRDELAQEQALRAKEAQRVRRLHSFEMDELRRIHHEEKTRWIGRTTCSPISLPGGEDEILGSSSRGQARRPSTFSRLGLGEDEVGADEDEDGAERLSWLGQRPEVDASGSGTDDEAYDFGANGAGTDDFQYDDHSNLGIDLDDSGAEPKGDTERFLAYLDTFQAKAERMIDRHSKK